MYRDGCKKSQPLSTAGSTTALSRKEDARRGQEFPRHISEEEASLTGPPRAVRHRLPEERASVTHKFEVGGHEGYITVGLYPDGCPGEIFVTMAKEGSTVSGLMDSFSCSISLALQHGVPLKMLCEKFAHTRFEPSGWSKTPEIGYAKSVMDYIFRWLQLRFLTGQQQMLFDTLRPKLSGVSSQLSEVGELVDFSRPSANRISSCRRCLIQHDRFRRRPNLQLLRINHDPEWKLLSLHELREHQRVLIGFALKGRAFRRAVSTICRTAWLKARPVTATFRLVAENFSSFAP